MKNPGKTKMKFVADGKKKAPAKSLKSPSGGTNKVKDVLPTKDGIYKRVPVKSPSSAPVKKKSAPKMKKPGKNKIQFTRERAEKYLRKNVRSKQKRGRATRMGFNK